MPFNYKLAQQNIITPDSSEETEEIQQIPPEEVVPQEIPTENIPQEIPQEDLESNNFTGGNIPNIAQVAQDIESAFTNLKNNTIMDDLPEDKQKAIIQGVLNNLGDFLNVI
jgi:hypothetical protein